jgi:hypothetical protein
MKYRKKPIEVEAFQWNGNFTDLIKWTKSTPLRGSYNFEHKKGFFGKNSLLIKTNKGSMKAALGDWIIKGINNEYYPVRPDIFRQTYEKIHEGF